MKKFRIISKYEKYWPPELEVGDILFSVKGYTYGYGTDNVILAKDPPNYPYYSMDKKHVEEIF